MTVTKLYDSFCCDLFTYSKFFYMHIFSYLMVKVRLEAHKWIRDGHLAGYILVFLIC